MPPNAAASLQQAEIVFLGTVAQVTPADSSNRLSARGVIKFEVSRVWKGHVAKTFEMRSKTTGSNGEGFFGSDLIVGNQLLVFAHRHDGLIGTVYSTSVCSPTGPLRRYGNTLEELGKGRVPEPNSTPDVPQ
jgi:hypothetical protein